MSRLLVSVTASERPDLLALQLRNYDWALGPGVTHIIHVARKGRDAFLAGLDADPGIVLNPRSAETVVSNNFLGHVSNFRHAVAEGIPFDRFYMHTANDLLVRPGLPAAMAGQDVGLGRPVLIRSISKDYWREMVLTDERLLAHSRRHGIEGGVLKAHTDGAFFPREVFAAILDDIFRDMPEEALSPTATRYPPQEYWLACVLDSLVRSAGLRWGRNAILVLERTRGRGEPVTAEEVRAVHVGRAAEVVKTFLPESVYGLKYFSPDPGHPARAAVAAIMAGQDGVCGA
ncbi:hypothetical protein [Muricoccus radiodurans]|uniref:hypothetical protein n=1 Tax=Muricoccus radiodurans TaxID=2231721 RepID=UPI003CF05DA2